MNDKDKHKHNLMNYLKSQNLMFLASSSKDPWIATLYYAIDDNFDIYFISEQSALHSKNILKNNKVSCGVSDSNQKVADKKIGVQISGVVSKVVDENELKYALEIWNNANPGLKNIISFENLGKINTKIYVIRPDLIKFFNEVLYGPEGFKILKNNPKHNIVLKGLIDSESLPNKNLNEFVSIDIFKEKNPEGNPKYFHVHKVIVKGETIDEATHYISKKIKNGWYAVFWDKDLAYFIFKNKTILVPYNWSSKDFTKVINAANSVGIEEIHLSQIKKSMQDW